VVTTTVIDPIVHIAGSHVTVNEYLRQRCAWCGALLIDQDLKLVAVPVDQPPGSYPTWPAGELVAVLGNAMWIEAHKDGDPLPDWACARLDPAVTA
jgi:hypothetical protein